MKTPSLVSTAALVGVSALLLAGCSSGGSGGESSGGDAAATRACVILPDAASSPRWENFDRKYLEEGLEAAGFETDIQNAQGDVNKYATIADQQLTKGCGVMLLVDYQGAGAAVADKAKAEGIPVIAYDRPFDGRRLLRVVRQRRGRRARGPVDRRRPRGRRQGPGDRGRRLHGRRPRPTATPRCSTTAPSRSWRPPASSRPPSRRGSGTRRQVRDQLRAGPDLARRQGRRVWVANDTNAAGVITVLARTTSCVPVSGQDATSPACRTCCSASRPPRSTSRSSTRPTAAVETAVALLKGETPTADQELEDGTPYIAVTPQLVGPEQVKDVVAAGDADAPSSARARSRPSAVSSASSSRTSQRGPGSRRDARRDPGLRRPPRRPTASATLGARQRRRKETA